MKQKLSVTVDEKLLEVLSKLSKEGVFRNKSHLVEYALNQFLENYVNSMTRASFGPHLVRREPVRREPAIYQSAPENMPNSPSETLQEGNVSAGVDETNDDQILEQEFEVTEEARK